MFRMANKYFYEVSFVPVIYFLVCFSPYIHLPNRLLLAGILEILFLIL